ncbi:MAG: glutamine amidotransferase [Candidatus Omnitrophota bacterium]|jgi:uncharacterized membrane protein
MENIRLSFLNNWPAIGVIVLGLFAVLFSIWSYKGLAAVVRKRAALGLFILRLVTLSLMIAMVFMPRIEFDTVGKNPDSVIFILDNSESMNIKERGISRFEAAKSLIRDYVSRNKREEIHIYDLDGNEINGFFLKFAAAKKESTDLINAVGKIKNKTKSLRVKKTYLLSDGCDNSQENNMIYSLRGMQFPVDTVIFFGGSADSEGKDAGILDVIANKSSRIDEALDVECVIRNNGYDSVSIPLEIKRGSEVVAGTNIYLVRDDKVKKVKLKVAPDVYGEVVYTASLDIKEPPAAALDNVKKFVVTVRKEPIRVLYVDGFLRWEYKFLKRALEKDKDVELSTVLRSSKPAEQEKSSMRGKIFTKGALSKTDIVVLGDIETNYFTPEEMDNLFDFITNQGGSLVLLGGYNSFGKNGVKNSKIYDAIPVVLSGEDEIQVNVPFKLKLTDEGMSSEIFDITGNNAKNSIIWKMAPELDGYVKADRAKIGATVLAVHPKDSSRYEPRPIIAVQRYGRGRTIVILTDTLWKWSIIMQGLGYGDTLYSKFWSQTMRFMNPERKIQLAEERFEVSFDKKAYNEKDAGVITVSLPITERNSKTTSVSAIKGILLNETTGDKDSISFKPRGGFSYEAKVIFAQGGRYSISITAEDKNAKPVYPVQAQTLVVTGRALEFSNSGINERFLCDLSEATGGKTQDLKAFNDLKENTLTGSKRYIRRIIFSLWDSPFTFLILLGLLTLDWYIRKKNNIF